MSITEKINFLLKSKKIVSNWYIIPFIYFNLFFGDSITIKLKNNIKIRVRKHSSDLMAFFNIWVIGEYKEITVDLKSNDSVIDIGGHIGLFSIYITQFCNKGIILTYEPDKNNYELLKKNLTQNFITNVQIFNCAVSKNNIDKVEFFISDDEAAHSLIKKSKKTVEVKSISLQKIFEENKIEKCKLLKLDCEGSEYQILNNLPSEIFKKIEKIILEYHYLDENFVLFEELKNRIIDEKFEVLISEPKNGMGIISAWKKY